MISVFSSLASPNSTRSSVKKRCERLGPPLPNRIGFHFQFETARLIAWPSFSVSNTNKYGNMGSPCLTPLEGLNSIVEMLRHNA